MRFAHPAYLALFLLMPFMVGLYLWVRIRQKRLWEKFADPTFKSRIVPNFSNTRGKIKTLLKISVFFFVIFALMEPQWGSREEEVRMRGINVMVLVDVSDSMLAEDVKPSRLARMKREIRDLLRILSGDRVGLIAFAGRSFLMSPLTSDYKTLVRYVDELGPETIPVKGTDLAGAITLAMKSFPQGDEGKAILIFTDGEDHSEKMKAIAKKLKEGGIKVFVLGIGTPDGAPIPEPHGGFKSNPQGKTIVSKLKEDFLKDFALKSGGAYVRTLSGAEDLEELYIRGIRGALNPQDMRVSRKKIWESRFYWPLGIALALLALERLIPEARRKKRIKEVSHA